MWIELLSNGNSEEQMAIVNVLQTTGFDNRNFWVANTGVSGKERFDDFASTTGNPLRGERTDQYDSFKFDSAGIEYSYGGDWAVHAHNVVLTASVDASGNYDSVTVGSGGQSLASVSGLDFDVNLGNRGGLNVLSLL